MPEINVNGLLGVSTNNTTWVAPSENFPVTLSNQQRGGVMVITGAAGDQLLDINGRLLQDGQIVFNQAEYTESPGVVRTANTYYTYQSGIARAADGTVPNAGGNWTELQTGGGGAATALADIPALNARAALVPEPAAGEQFVVLDPREADDANPTINNLPAGIDWDAAATANLNLTVAWDADDDDWNFVRIEPDNIDDQFVEVTGDTMTGSLTMAPNADIIFTGTDNTAPTPVNRTITVSVPVGDAAFDSNYELVLPPADPTNANRFLRVSNAVDQQGNITSPYTLAWAAGGGGAAGNMPTGGGTDEIFYENMQTVTADYSITPARNAGSFGPITINNGIVVTIPNNCNWTII